MDHLLHKLMVICLMVFFWGASVAGADPESAAPEIVVNEDELAKLIFQKVEMARVKLQTSQYDLEMDEKVMYSTMGPFHRITKGSMITEGNKVFALLGGTFTALRESKEPTNFGRTVINDDFTARMRGSSVVQVDHEKDPAKITPAQLKMRGSVADLPAHVDKFLFGNGVQMLSDIRLQDTDTSRWQGKEIIDEQGRRLYQLGLYTSAHSDPDVPVIAYTVDPDKGYLITKTSFLQNDGRPWMEKKNNLVLDAATGQWFPDKIEETEYQYRAIQEVGSDNISRYKVVTLTNVKINEPVDPKLFTLAALGFDETANFYRIGTDGTRYGMVSGQWVPQEIASVAKQISDEINSLNQLSMEPSNLQPADTVESDTSASPEVTADSAAVKVPAPAPPTSVAASTPASSMYGSYFMLLLAACVFILVAVGIIVIIVLLNNNPAI